MEVTFTNHIIHCNFVEAIVWNKYESGKNKFWTFLQWKVFPQSISWLKAPWKKKVLPLETTVEFVAVIELQDNGKKKKFVIEI